jgi:hypothetical protein
MSYANFGPVPRTKTVVNAGGVLSVAAVAAGGVMTSTQLIREAGPGAEIPLVLGAGTYILNCRAVINPNNAGSTIISGQCFVTNLATGVTISAGGLIAGCSYADGTNADYVLDWDSVIVLAAETSCVLRYRTTGSSQIQPFTAGTSMSAISLN